MEPEHDAFHAIADGTRRSILDLLRDGEKPVQELVGHFDMSFPAVSQHLAVLRRAGLVSRRAQGRRRLYRAEPRGLEAVLRWIAFHREFWEQGLDRLEEVLERDS